MASPCGGSSTSWYWRAEPAQPGKEAPTQNCHKFWLLGGPATILSLSLSLSLSLFTHTHTHTHTHCTHPRLLLCNPSRSPPHPHSRPHRKSIRDPQNLGPLAQPLEDEISPGGPVSGTFPIGSSLMGPTVPQLHLVIAEWPLHTCPAPAPAPELVVAPTTSQDLQTAQIRVKVFCFLFFFVCFGGFAPTYMRLMALPEMPSLLTLLTIKPAVNTSTLTHYCWPSPGLRALHPPPFNPHRKPMRKCQLIVPIVQMRELKLREVKE